MHIKTIVAKVIIKLSKESNENDFSQYIDRFKNLLIHNLNDASEDIRKECAIALAQIMKNRKTQAIEL